MGRKPNALILEFFHRGAKLEDQSNRYEHTCKMCGMLFPKGRPDSMNRHLFEKCPNISDYDKARAFAYAQGQMDFQRFGNRMVGQNDNMQTMNPFVHHASHEHDNPGPNATINREPSALDTLAEVSRQHLDLSRQRFQSDASGIAHHDPALDTHEMDNWMIQLQQQLAEANDAEDARVQRSFQQNTDMNPLIETASAANQLNASLEDPAIPQAVDPTPPAQANMVVSQPSERAESEGVVSQENQADQHTNLDPALHPPPSSLDDTNARPQPVPVPPNSSNSHLNLQALYDYNNSDTLQAPEIRGFGLLARPTKKQRRNKFSAERRKEVGGIRKMGACLRCRMLKKPCSGETPCSTCTVIDAPRVWRAACIRTRVADEFTLYNTSYFYAKARDKVNALVGSKQVEKSGGEVAVSFFKEETTRLAFPALQTCQPTADDGAVDLTDEDATDRVYALQIETQDAIKTVESYLDQEHEHFIAAESNKFLRITLQTLKLLDKDRKDILVARTVLLWAATSILASPATLSWSISHNLSSSSPASPTPIPSTHPSFTLLQSQLLDAIERYASLAIKQVCNDLERRLLARATSTSTITLLVTVILLNSVERMSYLFRTFDPRSSASSSNLDSGPAAPPDWPLTRPPLAYYSQGASFSALLHLLLRMRSLPPKTVSTPPDGLAVVKVRGATRLLVAPRSDDETFAMEGDDAHLVMSATWLARCSVGWGELVARARKGDDDVTPSLTEGGMTGWDLRFVARVVLGEGWEEMGAGGQTEGLTGGEGEAVEGGVMNPALGMAQGC